jgi:hypothetical protein
MVGVVMSLPVVELAQAASLVLAAGAPVWNFLRPKLQTSGMHLAETAYDKLSVKVGGWLGKCFGDKEECIEEPAETIAQALQPQLEQDPEKSVEVQTLLMQLVNQNEALLKALIEDHKATNQAFSAMFNQQYQGDTEKVININHFSGTIQ